MALGVDTRTVWVEFTRPRGFKPLSWLIRKVQKTEFSHVRLYWLGVGGTIPIIYEASGSSLKFIGPIAAKQMKIKIIHSFKLDITPAQYKDIVKICMINASIDYGKKQLIGIGLVHAFNLDKNPFADGRRSQVCSEIIGRILKMVLKWPIKLDLDIAGPKELYKEISLHFSKGSAQ
jgi:hypothetical protein